MFSFLYRKESILTLNKKNCWEYKKCGQVPGGNQVNKLGICPVVKDSRLDKVHGGVNAGRACWVVAGTLCGGKVQGVFAQKYKTCKDCDFYKKVLAEESSKFVLTLELMERLKKSK